MGSGLMFLMGVFFMASIVSYYEHQERNRGSKSYGTLANSTGVKCSLSSSNQVSRFQSHRSSTLGRQFQNGQRWFSVLRQLPK